MGRTVPSARPDVVSLDIQMPGPDGFGVLHVLDANAVPVIVFVTACDELAVVPLTSASSTISSTR